LKAYGGVKVHVHSFLTLATDEYEWSDSQTALFRGKSHLYPLNMSMGNSQSDSGRLEEEKNLLQVAFT
jgi:hypothetical protein